MAEIDTSGYPQPTQPINPLATYSQFQQAQGLQNQNRLFNQTYNTNLALGQIYKQAIDPNTGQLDPTKIPDLIKSNPNVTLALPEAIQQSQEAQQRMIGIDTSKLENVNKHLSSMWNLLSSVDPGQGQKGVISAIGDGIAQGLFTPQQIGAELSNNPLPNDANGIQQWKNQYLLRILDGANKINAQYGPTQQVDTGSNIDITQTPQMGGPTVLRATIAKSLPPTTTVIGPDNAPHYLGGGGQGGSPLAGAFPGAGGASNIGGLGPQSDYAPGVKEAGGVTGTASANQGVALQQSADQVPQIKALLGNLDAALDKYTSGPSANWAMVSKAFVNQALPQGLQFDPKAVASQEEFNKQALQLAQSQFQALGGTGTDAKLESTMHTSPNEALSPMGNKAIIALLKGNADAIAAKNQAWQNYLQTGGGPQNYGQFSTKFNKTYDPRVFQFQYMPPAERASAVKGMTPAEQKTFLGAYRTAINNGWVPNPAANANGGQ